MKKIISLILAFGLFLSPLYAGDTTGLVGAYLMNSSANGQETDASGLSNTLSDTNSSVGSTTGQFGNARIWDNNSDLLSRADDSNFDFTDDFSIVMWLNTSDVNNTRDIVNKGTSLTGWHFRIDDTEHMVLRCTATNATDTNTVTTGSFQHIAAVFDNSADVVTFYRNGTGNDIAQTGVPADTSSSLIFGLNQSQTNPNGAIDEVAIFSRELTSDEVNELKNSGIEAYMSGSRRYSPIFMWAMFGVVLFENFNYFALVNAHRVRFGIERPEWMKKLSPIFELRKKPILFPGRG